MVNNNQRAGTVAVMYVLLSLLFYSCSYVYDVRTDKSRYYIHGSRDITFKVFEDKNNTLGYYDQSLPIRVRYLESRVIDYRITKYKLK